MTAYVVIHATVKNPAKMAEYSAAAGPSVASFGGEFNAEVQVKRCRATIPIR